MSFFQKTVKRCFVASGCHLSLLSLIVTPGYPRPGVGGHFDKHTGKQRKYYARPGKALWSWVAPGRIRRRCPGRSEEKRRAEEEGRVAREREGSLFTRHFHAGWSCLTGGLMRYYLLCEGNIAYFPRVLHPVPVFLWPVLAFIIDEFGEEETT